MELASSRELNATEIIMDTQTEIKELIRDAMYDVRLQVGFLKRAEGIIVKNLEEVKEENLKAVAKMSLLNFAKIQYENLVRMLGLGNTPLLLAVLIKSVKIDGKEETDNEFISRIGNQLNLGGFQAELKAEMLNKPENVIHMAFANLGDSQAKTQGGQSVYGYSELVLRHEAQQKMIDDLRQQTNLVICDTHADCSDRCFPWQGKVYSLDGTSGVTSDGRKYQPLEVATSAKDKYGHVNGLLGYNCRHRLMPYKDGRKAVTVTKEQQKKQNEITQQQRVLERAVRHADDQKEMTKYQSGRWKEYWEKRAKETRQEYIEFCMKNKRSVYRSRLK